jgi:hypothetical protein
MRTRIKLSELKRLIREEVNLNEGSGYTQKIKNVGIEHTPDEGSSGHYAVMDFVFDLPKLLAVSKTLHVFELQGGYTIVALYSGATVDDYIKWVQQENDVSSWEDYIQRAKDNMVKNRDLSREYKKDPDRFMKELKAEYKQELKDMTPKLIKTLQL